MSSIEQMGDFFNKRAETYDDHMRETVENFDKYYSLLSQPIKQTNEEVDILDMGCGTGIELEGIFNKAPNAKITGIDMSQEMLDKMMKKYKAKAANIKIIVDSYLTCNIADNYYDYIVSSMTMHHFLQEPKIEIYKKIRKSLKEDGLYIEGDYVVSDEEQNECLKIFHELMNTVKEENRDLYHIDIPFTLQRQKELLKTAGFKRIQVILKQENQAILVAHK